MLYTCTHTSYSVCMLRMLYTCAHTYTYSSSLYSSVTSLLIKRLLFLIFNQYLPLLIKEFCCDHINVTLRLLISVWHKITYYDGIGQHLIIIIAKSNFGNTYLLMVYNTFTSHHIIPPTPFSKMYKHIPFQQLINFQAQ